jgi:flagellar motor protein MotB
VNHSSTGALSKLVGIIKLSAQVKSDRLTSQGYGKTRPVADNNSDEGRAKNRRVEIANTACQAKRP